MRIVTIFAFLALLLGTVSGQAREWKLSDQKPDGFFQFENNGTETMIIKYQKKVGGKVKIQSRNVLPNQKVADYVETNTTAYYLSIHNSIGEKVTSSTWQLLIPQ